MDAYSRAEDSGKVSVVEAERTVEGTTRKRSERRRGPTTSTEDSV
jgi:hypothetical protein